MNTISCFIKDNVQAYKPFWIDGPPRVDNKTGLLLTVPHHSWIDTKNQSLSYAGWGFKDLPNRVSERFIKDLFNIVLENNKLQALLCSPDFFMPEINAQWITLLKGTIETIDLLINQRSNIKIDLKPVIEFKKTIQDILYTAEKNFKPIFWNEDNGFLFNIIYENMGVRDEIECETGVVAAAMLGETVFSLKELSSIWECTQKRLLVNRRPVKYGDEVLPFGIITKNNDQRIYYNDLQYHSDVIWLRSTPYIIKLLRLLNMDKTIEEILLNTLDHQMTEAAIFYNQELFSRPFGNNPSPEEKTCQNPVPVKNPIQFWSQWCDAFIDYFGKGGM